MLLVAQGLSAHDLRTVKMPQIRLKQVLLPRRPHARRPEHPRGTRPFVVRRQGYISAWLPAMARRPCSDLRGICRPQMASRQRRGMVAKRWPRARPCEASSAAQRCSFKCRTSPVRATAISLRLACCVARTAGPCSGRQFWRHDVEIKPAGWCCVQEGAPLPIAQAKALPTVKAPRSGLA